MKAVFPYAIDLTYTNVAANAEGEWSSGTTYGVGDLVKVTTAIPHTVYRSLRGNNTNRPPASWLEPQQEVGTSTTSNAVGTGALTFTTQTGLGFAAGMVVKIAKTATPNTVNMTAEVTAYNSGTGALNVTVYSTTGSGTHASWTITSEDEIGYWEEVGATNQYLMFDGYVNTQTENTDSIHVKLATERVDNVTLFGLDAVTVDLELWDSTETTSLWSESINLVYGAPDIITVSDWYEYFFGEITALTDVTKSIPVNSYSAVLEITITTASGETAKCGGVIVGREFEIGKTKYGASAGIVDYSRKTTDELGRTTLSQGYWAKRFNCQVIIPNYLVDSVAKKLTQLRGVPTAWIGTRFEGQYEFLTAYGTFRDFDITVEGPTRSYCNIEIEGLI